MNTLALQLIGKLSTPIAVATDTGTITYQNEAFTETFGASATDTFKTAARAVAGERGWLQTFFIDREGEVTREVELGGRIYRVARIVARAGAGEGHEAALSFDDVTSQREAEQAKSDFTSMIVHDLRGPLSGIQGTLEFVLGQESTKIDPLHQELLNEAQRESERMMNLINELLDFSKIETGNFEVGTDPVHLSGVLKRAVRSLQSVAARDEVYLLSAHGIDMPEVHGSIEKLTQAIINLISNSLKFTPKKGLISVGAQLIRANGQPEAIVVTVTDTGMGIKAADVEQIFEKYKQSKNKSIRGGGGTGLGLYIVKQVIEAHGGEVKVSSLEGVGTSMVLRLPVRRAAA